MSTPTTQNVSEPVGRGRIFVVDDSRTIRVQLRHLLSRDYSCEAFGDGPSALAAALAEPPDLIISDVLMEPYDGYELCRLVREQATLKGVPFVLLTSNEDRDGRAMGLESGADDYLSKPVHPRELFARVHSLLSLREAQQKVLRQQEGLRAANERLMQTQRELVQAEKMATLGVLAAGVSHEFNNPLGFVMSGVSQMVQSVDRVAAAAPSAIDEEELSELRQIKTEVLGGLERIRLIVQDLGRFAKNSEREHMTGARGDVRSEVDAAMVVFRPRLGNVSLQVELNHSQAVELTPGYLSQIVQNFLVNALEALEGVTDACIAVRSRDVEGGVEVWVEDNGHGVSEDVRARMFEPFFTTKPAGTGAGLGLSICESMAVRMAGRIGFEPGRPVGSCFRVFVPLKRPDSAAVFNRLPRADARKRSG